MTKRAVLSLIAVTVSTTICGRAFPAEPAQTEETVRPVIVLVAFGTSNPEARKAFDHIDAAARKRYPGHEIRWAYTSQFILKKLKRQGEAVQSLEEVVNDLRLDGHKVAVLQSLHVAPGQEYQEVRKVDTSGLQFAVGTALLSEDRDIEAVIAALGDEIKKDAANVIVCHGNQRHPQFNRQLVAFAEAIEAKYDEVVVCSINGRPGTEKLTQARRIATESGRVHFIPLMVVAGIHVAEDVLGYECSSWKSVVGAKETTCAEPLGFRDKVLAVYFRHLDQAIKELRSPLPAGGRQ